MTALSFGLNLEKDFYLNKLRKNVRLKKMAERKVVSRNVAIGLSVVCVVLSVGLVIALAVYLPTNTQIESLNAQVAQDSQTINGLNARIAALDSQVSSLNSSNSNVAYLQRQISDLGQQLTNYENILAFNVSSIFVNNQDFSMDPSTNATIWNQPERSFQYAGYVTVVVQSSSPTTFVELSYNSLGVVYDSVVTVGTSRTTSFPILPGTIIISLGNTEASTTVTGTVTATYYFSAPLFSTSEQISSELCLFDVYRRLPWYGHSRTTFGVIPCRVILAIDRDFSA